MAQDRTSSHPKPFGGSADGADSTPESRNRKPPDSSGGGADMSLDDAPSAASGKKNQVIEALHEKFDPGEKFPLDPEASGPKRSQKQPGQGPDDPQKQADGGE